MPAVFLQLGVSFIKILQVAHLKVPVTKPSVRLLANRNVLFKIMIVEKKNLSPLDLLAGRYIFRRFIMFHAYQPAVIEIIGF
jgi:hypothetical protein